jgi:hypothetical protein
MEKEKTYNQLIDCLRNTCPVLENQEETVRTIIEKAKIRTALNKRKRQQRGFIALLSGSVAACVLSGVMVFDIYRPTQTDYPQQASNGFVKSSPTKKIIPENNTCTLSESRKMVSAVIREKEELKAKKKTIINNIHNSQQKNKSI